MKCYSRKDYLQVAMVISYYYLKNMPDGLFKGTRCTNLDIILEHHFLLDVDVIA